MTYTLVRPSSLPYDGAAYSSLFGVSSTLPATAGAGGTSLADDLDTTSVTLASSQDDLGYQSTIVAVDFDAVPGLVDGSFFGTMFRLKRLADDFDTAIFSDDTWALFDNSGTFIRSSRMSDAAGNISSVSSSTATTYTTGNEWYGTGSHAAEMQAASFTLAMCVRASAGDGSHSAVDLYTIFECGLLLDIGDAAPPVFHAPVLRVFPRPDGRGASSAQRVWPRPPTGTYGRVGPGSLV